MKKFFFVIFLLASFLLTGSFVSAIELQRPTGYVNDFAGLFTPQDKAVLEASVRSYEAQTSNEIVIAIVPSFEGRDPFSYSHELFTSWKPGKKDKNNGILVTIGPKEGFPFPARGEMFIEVGAGLEGALPDSLTGSIIRNEIVPMFKEGQYLTGLQSGLSAIIAATKGEYKASDKGGGNSSWDFGGLINFVFIFGFALINYLFSFLARSKSFWLGGIVGVISGAILGLLFFELLGIVFAALGFGGFGLILDYFLSKNYEKRKREGKPTDFWHSGGGFWFGGGGSGGGFGGFGGGGSRGGGAGGGW